MCVCVHVRVCVCKSILALEQFFVSAFRLPDCERVCVCVSVCVCVCVCVCVSEHASVIYHRRFVFPPLRVFVFTCSSYLIWPHGRSKSQHARGGIMFSPCEGQIAEDQLRSGVTCSP